MLTLESLTFKGIGRFVEEQNIEFSELGAFVQIDGKNNNSNGSSGSGKSTIFKALEYLLDINSIPATILQSRFTKDPISVTGKFKWDDRDLTITRNKSKLSLLIDNEPISGSNALAEEKIDQILGMPRDLFRQILHKRQDEGGFFLNFTPQKMYNFLIDCLELGEYKKKLEKVESEIAKILDRKKKIESDLVSAKASLSATQEAILSIGLPPIREMHREVVIELKAKADAAEKELNDKLAEAKVELDTLMLEKPNVEVQPFDSTNLDQYTKELKEIETKIAALHQTERDRVANIKAEISRISSEQKDLNYKLAQADQARKEALTLADQIKKIRSAHCPTCEQEWLTDSAKTTEEALIKKLITLKDIIGSSDSISVRIKENEDLIVLMKSQDDGRTPEGFPEAMDSMRNREVLVMSEKKKRDEHLEGQNRVNRVLSSAFEAKRQQLTSKHSAEAAQYRGQVELSRRTLDIAVGKLKAYEEAKIRYDSSLVSLKEKEVNFTNKIEELQNELNSAENELLIDEEIKKLLKTYLSYSFDDALDAIGDKATEIIRCIPNMSNATIQFEGTKETKDGKVREEVNAVIGMDGEVGIPIKSLSGGERSSTDLAVDLAVIDFIESKSGKGINVFILDEPFKGLGTVEIEMALEVLRNSNTNKKLIIVDHNPEVKEMVQSRLVVERTGTTSQIVSKETNV